MTVRLTALGWGGLLFPPRLLPDAVQQFLAQHIAELSANCNPATLGRMLELTVVA